MRDLRDDLLTFAQILRSALKRFWRIINVTKDAIATCAEQPPNFSGRVTMVNVKSPFLRFPTNCATPILIRKHLVVGVERDTVLPHQMPFAFGHWIFPIPLVIVTTFFPKF